MLLARGSCYRLQYVVVVPTVISSRFATPHAVSCTGTYFVQVLFFPRLHLHLQYVDVSSSTVKERLVQGLVVVEVDEGGKLLQRHVSVIVGIHFFHKQPQFFIVHLNKESKRASAAELKGSHGEKPATIVEMSKGGNDVLDRTAICEYQRK